MDGEISKSLAGRLRAIYDDDDFVLGTIACLGSDAKVERMLSYLNTAEANGDSVSHDDAIAASILISEGR